MARSSGISVSSAAYSLASNAASSELSLDAPELAASALAEAVDAADVALADALDTADAALALAELAELAALAALDDAAEEPHAASPIANTAAQRAITSFFIASHSPLCSCWHLWPAFATTLPAN